MVFLRTGNMPKRIDLEIDFTQSKKTIAWGFNPMKIITIHPPVIPQHLPAGQSRRLSLLFRSLIFLHICRPEGSLRDGYRSSTHMSPYGLFLDQMTLFSTKMSHAQACFCGIGDSWFFYEDVTRPGVLIWKLILRNQ